MNKGLTVGIVIVILLIITFIIFISMKSPTLNRKQNNCVYNKLIDRYKQVNNFSGKIKFTNNSILPNDMYIYLDPNSIIEISDKQIITTDLELTIDRFDISDEFIKIRNDCELTSSKLGIVVFGNDAKELSYSIKTLDYPAIIFLEKGLRISGNK